MKENENALNYVKKFIEDLIGNLRLNIWVDAIEYDMISYAYNIGVRTPNIQHIISLDKSIIDDLEVALEKYRRTRYFDSLESSIKFSIYIQLGREGVLDEFIISQELINDKREWIRDYKVDLHFDDEMTQELYNGLKELQVVFTSQIAKHRRLGLETSEIEEHKEWVQEIINYYDSNHNLNSKGVKIKNLQYLKVAAIKQIMDLEKIRKNERAPTTRKALNKKIYNIVFQLRKDPFLEIQLPNFIDDIVAADG
ncbi:MAG: hypothetical protein ACFE8P_12075 [Promethearchaeota archaeon]